MNIILTCCHGSSNDCHMIDFVGADLSDYFNYGFTEETWKQYCEKQRKTRYEVSQLNKIAVSHGTHLDSRSLASYSLLHPGRIHNMYSCSSSLATLCLGSSENCGCTACHHVSCYAMLFAMLCYLLCYAICYAMLFAMLCYLLCYAYAICYALCACPFLSSVYFEPFHVFKRVCVLCVGDGEDKDGVFYLQIRPTHILK